MSFCKNCGTQVQGQFCPSCGTPAAAPAQGGAPPPPPPAYQQAAPPPPAYQQAPPAYQQAPPPPPGYQQAPPAYQQAPPPAAAGSGLTDNVASALCYLFGAITGIVFLVLEPYNKNKTIRFHAFQSIFLNVVWIVVWIALSIFFSIVFHVLPYSMWFLISLINWVIMLGIFILWVLLMVKAYQNQKLVLPIIGQLAEKQA